MKYTNLKATVLIYTIVLVNISLLMAIVMLNNSSILSSNREVEALDTKLTTNLRYKSDVNLKYHRTLNSNGSGFSDVMSCPDSVTLSGSTQITSNTSTVISHTGTLESGVIYCSGTHVGNEFKLYFNADYDDIEIAEYLGESILLDQVITSNIFSDPDTTNIILTNTGYVSTGDNIDDDFNSDNYHSNSTGATSYPPIYGDDDSLARTFIYGYVSPTAGLSNIFWNNSKTNEYIDSNTNNDNSIYAKASTASGYVYLDADKPFDIRVVEFDRTTYDDFNELRVNTSVEYSSASGALGYIQTDATLSGSTTSGYQFDFLNNDYGIFIDNTGTGTLFYQISAIDVNTGTGLYINPIKDDEPSIIRVLGNDIFVNDQGKYIAKQAEIVTGK